MKISKLVYVAILVGLLAAVLSNTEAEASVNSTYPGNVQVQDDLRNRIILAVSYLDLASPVSIWDGLTPPNGAWGADWPGRTLEAYSRTSLTLGYRSSTRFDEIRNGLLSRQSSDGAFHTGDGDAMGGYGLWFGNNMGMMGLLWAYDYMNDSNLTPEVKLGDYFIHHYFDPIYSPQGSFHWVGIEGLVKLYKVSGNLNYLNLAKQIADTVPAVNPISQHTHSYLRSLRGILQVYEISGESKYLTMVLQQYAYFRDHVMWPGGGIVEHLGNAESQSLNYWFDESESAFDWMGLNMDLWRITQDSTYMDMVERIALNHLLYSQDVGGGFVGDRGVDFTREGAPWPFCCAMAGARTLSELTEYIANIDANTNTVYVNLFYPSRTKLAPIDVNVVLETSYPLTGKVRVKFEMNSSTQFTLKYRLPAWSSLKYVALNGLPFSAAIENGYLALQRTWADKDILDIEIDMPVRTEARTHFIGDDGATDYSRVSLWKGPRQLVYNQELNNHLWELKNARPALRYVYQIYENLQFDKSSRGTSLQIGSNSYSKGLGVHSVSEIEYALNGQFKRFKADIGIDECVGNSGSVRFKVCVDGAVVYQHGNVYGSDAAIAVDIDVLNAQVLRLVVDDAVDGATNDCADWADARLTRPDDSVVYLSDLPDDRTSGLPWDFGKVRLVESGRDKGGSIVTLGYRMPEGFVPIKFNYLADLGYSLIGHRPVLNSFMKTTCPQILAEDLNDDCSVSFADIVTLSSNWLQCNDVTQ